MNLISAVTDNTLQQQTLVLADGTTFTMTMYYIPMQYGWFITSLTYGSFAINGMRICVSPNLLYQFQNQIPFGLACFSNVGGREPTQQQDFSSGAFSLYILSQVECQQLRAYIQGGALPSG